MQSRRRLDSSGLKQIYEMRLLSLKTFFLFQERQDSENLDLDEISQFSVDPRFFLRWVD